MTLSFWEGLCRAWQSQWYGIPESALAYRHNDKREHGSPGYKSEDKVYRILSNIVSPVYLNEITNCSGAKTTNILILLCNNPVSYPVNQVI